MLFALVKRIFAIMLIAVLVPNMVQAQNVAWNQRDTQYMAILYPTGSDREADFYATFVDTLYTEVTAQIGYTPQPPLTLRIYPTLDLYRQVNPIAQLLEGVVAHAHTGRREISVALPQTQGMSEEDVRNNIRHELVHIIAAELSDNQLSVMWQEGIAQYVEKPADQPRIKVQLLRQAVDAGRILAWRDLDAAGMMYSNPALGYPQSWSMVSFLIERNGMPTFVKFIEAMKTASGWRGALQETYGVSPDQLELEWKAQLATWLDGGWQEISTVAFDQASIQQAIDEGRYRDALAAAESALHVKDDPELNALRNQAQTGIQADDALANARIALLEGRYADAQTAVDQARPLYAQLQRNDLTSLIDQYAARATDGQRAYAMLDDARSQMSVLRLSSARSNIEQAGMIFGTLGDQKGRNTAQALLTSLNRRIQIAGIGLMLLVVLGLAWNIDRRRALRRSQKLRI